MAIPCMVIWLSASLLVLGVIGHSISQAPVLEKTRLRRGHEDGAPDGISVLTEEWKTGSFFSVPACEDTTRSHSFTGKRWSAMGRKWPPRGQKCSSAGRKWCSPGPESVSTFDFGVSDSCCENQMSCSHCSHSGI